MHRLLFALLCVVILIGGVAYTQDHPAKTRFCAVGAGDLADASAPRFDQYSAKASAPATPASLKVQSNPIGKTYPTVLRREMKEGANFAGHYRVAIWGCGSSCAQFAVLDLSTGRIITANGVAGVSGAYLSANDFLSGTDSDAWGFRFKRDSRLLVLVGTLNEDNSKEGAFYYVLNGDKLDLVHKTLGSRNKCTEDLE